MQLNLLRAVMAQVGDNKKSLQIQGQFGNVAIFSTHAVCMEEKPLFNILVASLSVEVPIESDGSIEIPDEPRKQAEATLETVVRLMAIDRQLTHSISSPMPFIGFTSEEPSVFEKLDGIKVNQSVVTAYQNANNAVGLFDGIDLMQLTDRLDGVALLAEALNSSSALGRYMQLIRLFERAFKLGPGGITMPLADFRRPSPFGINLAEVETWTAARALTVVC
jgi:hypothetical protein